MSGQDKQDTAVFGIYTAYASAEYGVGALRTAGFRNSDISVLYSESTDTKDLAQEAQAKSNKVQQGASTGGGTGALVGGALGSIVGSVGLAIPGVGPFMAAGPILGALAGAGFGAVLGEIAGALIGMGLPEDEAKRYERRVTRGGFLLSVHSDSSEWTQRAQEILQQTGAQDIFSTASQRRDRRAAHEAA